MNLRRLKYFVKIVDIGSLTQAADVLHIAQPALSQQIATLEGEFAFAIPATTPPRRVRWCLGVAPFDAEAFLAPETVAAGSLWQAGDGAARAQRTLCTPWFDVAARAFQPG